jgi:hypothetical protein
MRTWVALTLVLLSGPVLAEDWVILRKPPETGTAPAGIFVDATSIEILDTGIRRARVKIDFLSRRVDFEKFGPNAVSFMIVVKSYNCEKQLTHEESMESHQIDGSVQASDSSKDPKWYPAPQNRAADPTINFVCGWKVRSVTTGHFRRTRKDA